MSLLRKKTKRKSNVGSGTSWVWLTAGSVAFCLVLVIGVIGIITVKGLAHFWPSPVVRFVMSDRDVSKNAIGEIVDSEKVLASRLRETGIEVNAKEGFVERILLKVGNRDIFGLDFKWFIDANIVKVDRPLNVAVIERNEWGNFYGFVSEVLVAGVPYDKEKSDNFFSLLDDVLDRRKRLVDEINSIEKQKMGHLNSQLEKLRLAEKKIRMASAKDLEIVISEIKEKREEIHDEYESLGLLLTDLYKKVERDVIGVKTGNGDKVMIPVKNIVGISFPNRMDVFEKLIHYFKNVWTFVSENPREANTEGGIFPAIFGTVIMVLLMAIIVAPFGVIAAVYLNEYATQGPLTRVIRIAVNNLAGVPSVVYGVFGLGFFVYFIGGSIDDIFYPEAAPAPVFGTPGILWSSLTLALLTVPVVIVSTEEGLTRIPRSIREGSLALGATKAETLWKTVLPMATPAMMTGLILAIARAAGEVAPLMMVGVVKMAPALPIDTNFPYVHLERKFMHLGFHIYDVGFQSPNVEAARPLVYATSFLLIVIIVSLNMTAISIRNKLREKYNATET